MTDGSSGSGEIDDMDVATAHLVYAGWPFESAAGEARRLIEYAAKTGRWWVIVDRLSVLKHIAQMRHHITTDTQTGAA